ncbi:MAG: hypothetical protein ACI8XC_000972 [Gammaproteobacteria bacterium]|jgi:hypothetical protein
MQDLPLRSIHDPSAVVWWPPAPGWWILAFFLILAGILIYLLVRFYRHRRLRRECQALFSDIRKGLREGQSPQEVVGQLTILLRRILMSYKGRQNIANLTDQSWIDELNRLTRQNYFDSHSLRVFGQYRYQRKFEPDIERVLTQCDQWIKKLPPGERNVAV